MLSSLWLLLFSLPFLSSPLNATVLIKKIEQGSRIGCMLFEIQSRSGIKAANPLKIKCWNVSAHFQGKGASPSHVNDNSVTNQPWSDDSLKKENVLSPVPWFGDQAIDFAISNNSLCAILKNKTVACVGDGYTGHFESHRDFKSLSNTPIQVPLGSEIPIMISSNSEDNYYRWTQDMFCVSTHSNRIHCWRANDISPFIVEKEGPQSSKTYRRRNLSAEKRITYGTPHTTVYSLNSPIKKMSLHEYRLCALLENGEVKCHSPYNFQGLFGTQDETMLNEVAIEFRNRELPVNQENNIQKEYDLKSPFYSLQKKNQKAIDVHIGSAHTCITYEDGTADCWGSIGSPEGGASIPEKKGWYHFEFLSLKKRELKLPLKSRFYVVKSQHQKVEEVLPDGPFQLNILNREEGACFRLSPGAPDGSSNIKCTNYQTTTQPFNAEYWLDELPWVPIPLPVKKISLAKVQSSTKKNVCFLFINQAAICEESLYKIIHKPNSDYLQILSDSLGTIRGLK